MPDDHPFAGVRAQPLGATAKQPWLLGSPALTAQLAAQFGLPYCMHTSFTTATVAQKRAMPIERPSSRADTARDRWQACAYGPTPHRPRNRDRTLHRPFPGPAELATRTLSAREEERVEQLRRTTVHGSAKVTAARIRRLAEEFAVDEIVIVTMTHDPADRLLSYRLIAAEMGFAAPVNMRRQLPLVESIS